MWELIAFWSLCRPLLSSYLSVLEPPTQPQVGWASRLAACGSKVPIPFLRETSPAAVRKLKDWDFPGGQWLRLHTSSAEGTDSIPDWGTKLPQLAWCGQKKIKGPLLQPDPEDEGGFSKSNFARRRDIDIYCPGLELNGVVNALLSKHSVLGIILSGFYEAYLIPIILWDGDYYYPYFMMRGQMS